MKLFTQAVAMQSLQESNEKVLLGIIPKSKQKCASVGNRMDLTLKFKMILLKPVAIVVEFVVAGVGKVDTESGAHRVEYLNGSVCPYLETFNADRFASQAACYCVLKDFCQIVSDWQSFSLEFC